MMYNFKSTLVFGIIIRHICADPYSNNIFQDKQDEIILQNLLFVSDFVTEIALGQENGPFNIQQIQNPLDQEIIYWKQFTQSNCQQLKQIIQHLVNNIYVPDDDFDFIQKYLAQQPEDTEQKLVGNIWLIPSQLAEYIDSIRILYADFIKYSMNKYEKFVKQVLIKLPIQSTLQIQNINTFQYTVDQLQILSQISPSPKLKNIKILAVQFSDDLPIEIDHSISDKLYYMKENLTQVTQEFTQACQITILEPIFFKSSELTYYQNTCLRLIQIFEIENLIQSQISHIQSLQFENEDEFNLVFTDLQEQSAQIISKSNDNLNKMADFQDILDSYRYQSGLIERLVQILELILNDQSEPIYNNIDVEIDTQLIQDTLQELLLQDESSNLPLIQAIKWHNSSVNHVSLAKAKQFVPQTIFERVFMFKDQNQHDFNSEIKSKLYD
ncbi:hypothetical protein SS50377_25578 [Spironucleus salmonicida]|nr:hypothetical protein SS50377_25578 [Spironucleus salmonicida]